MKPAPFAYHAPRCIDEALATLAEVAPNDGRVLAGGQSLVPAMALRLARPAHLVDINGVNGLDELALDGALRIGACVRHSAFDESGIVPGPLGALLCQVASHIAHLPIRTRGTFCGSIAHADPAAEWCLLAATLDATMVAASVRGERAIPAAAFFRGALSTALASDELLAHVRLPLLADASRFGFCEFSRRSGDFAIAMALATFRLDGGVIADARIGIGGVESVPRRIARAEAILEGIRPDATLFRAAAQAVAEVIEPMDDEGYPPAYRRDVACAMTLRALERTLA
jgi:carbon-monoxide dehydrogenase medium subunit